MFVTDLYQYAYLLPELTLETTEPNAASAHPNILARHHLWK